MPRTFTGTVLEYGGSGLTLSDYKELMRKIRSGDRRSFRDAGFKFAAEGDSGTNTIKIITDAGKTSTIVGKLQAELNDMLVGRGISGSFAVDDVDLRIRNSHLDYAKSLAAIRALGETSAIDVNYDRSSKTLTTMYEASRSDLTRKVAGYVGTGRRVENDNKAMRELALGEYSNRTAALRSAHARMATLAMADPTNPLVHQYAMRMKDVTARTPGTPEFYNKIFRNIRASEARQDAIDWFIEANPKSRLAINARRRKWAARGRGIRRFAGGVARIARNTIALTIGAILTTVTLGVTLLAKSFQIITQIGTDVRKRAVDEAKYNFAPDTIRQFEMFASQHPGLKYQEDLLIRAAGGIHTAWSTPLNYTEGGFNQLAPYLREGTVKLVSMATASGDVNVLNMMGNVIDDLVQKSLSGISGAKSGIDRHRAFSGNLTALAAHNEAWGELMNQYWHDFIKSGANSIADWKEKDRNGAMRTMTFENWVTQGSWHPKYVTDTGLSSPTIRDAARQTNELLQQFIGTYSNLARDIATAVAGSMGGAVEWLRNIVNNWLAPYFPAFAMREDQRSIYLNERSMSLASSLLPGYEAAAKRALLDIGYDYGLDEFKPILDAIQRGDTSRIPYHINLESLRRNMGAFTRYYHVRDIITQVAREEVKSATDRNYVQRAIVATSENIATISGERAQILQYKLDRGTASVRVVPVEADMEYSFTDYLKQLGIVTINIPNAIARFARNLWSDIGESSVETAQRKVDEAKEALTRPAVLERESVRRRWLDMLERAHRGLVKAYDKADDPENALKALWELHEFYVNYPVDLVRIDPDQRRRMNEHIASDSEWLWMGNNFARATQVLHPADLAAQTYAKIMQIEAQMAYSREHGGLESRGAQQQRTTHEITAAGFAAKIDEQMGKVFDASRQPELQAMYYWLADKDNSIHVDAFNEQLRRPHDDIIINFITDGVVKSSLRIPGKDYNLRQDINLTDRAGIVMDLAPAFEAASRANVTGGR